MSELDPMDDPLSLEYQQAKAASWKPIDIMDLQKLLKMGEWTTYHRLFWAKHLPKSHHPIPPSIFD